MKVLFVFIVLEHRRRQVLHFNVTEHPTADWTSQQIVEAFADREAARYLIRDRDKIYGSGVHLCTAFLGMEEVLSAPQSPWQNPHVERLIVLNQARLLESLRDTERETSEANACFLFRLLSQVKDASWPRQTMSTPTPGVEHRKDHRHPAIGRSASPL